MSRKRMYPTGLRSSLPDFIWKNRATFRSNPESDDGIFVTGLVRGVIQNQMAGKGYATQPLDLLDRKLTSSEGKGWETLSSEKLCQVLDVDALIYPQDPCRQHGDGRGL